MRWRVLALALACSACGGTPAASDAPSAGAVPATSAPADAIHATHATAPAGVRLQANVASREELLQRMRPWLSRSRDDVTPVHHPDGRTSFPTQRGFGHAMLVTRAPDGSTRHVCVDSIAGAERVMRIAAEGDKPR